MQPIQGLHHITAVAREPQRNVNFYRNILGQRLIKKTVNFDVPDTYHFYYADYLGTPGSVMTHFAWPKTRRAVRGNGTTAALAYNLPAGSLGFWQEYLKGQNIKTEPIETRFGAGVLSFDDPDGLRIELIESAPIAGIQPWPEGPIPAAHELQGFHSTTLWLEDIQPTADLLTQHMGYTFAGQEANRYRFIAEQGTPGSVLDLLHRPGGNQAVFGAGSIHHIAFRVPNDETELAYQASLRQAGFGVTPVRDRSYFHSIYFNEPGGVLFEIATNTPGFDLDESQETLGEALKLPEWLEPQRPEIEQGLAPLSLLPIKKAAHAA